MANVITLLRVILALLVLMIIQLSPLMNLMSIGLIIVSMVLDALDGYIARYLNTSTVQGSIYDILADRIIENIFFIYFAVFSIFSVWFAVVIMIRGLTIDAIRTICASEGKTAFGQKTLHRQTWTKLLACSKLSRGSYNTLKMLTFIFCAALLMPESIVFKWTTVSHMQFIANVCVWSTVILSLIRAVPVLFDGWSHYLMFNQEKL